MASLFPNATTYAGLVTADSDFRAILWSRIFENQFRYKSTWRDFIGGEGSLMPIVKKTDLSAGIAQDVVFNFVSDIGGQGKLGGNLLREATRQIDTSSFRVRLDAERQGVSYNQLINWLRADMNPERVAVEKLSNWAVRKHDDNIHTLYRRYATVVNPNSNLARPGTITARNSLLSTSYIDTTFIEKTKAFLMANGATPISTNAVMSQGGGESPQYLFVSPDAALRALRVYNSTFINSLNYAQGRGSENPLFTGRYPLWDNNVLYPDNTGTTDADARQGTPLLPIAFLGTALTDGTTTTVTGGGTTNPAGTADYFANFPGYPWYITTTDMLPTDNTTYNAMIFNLTGADAGKYEIVSYTSAGFAADGSTLTVTRGSGSDGAGNQRALGSNRYQNTHPSGSVIVPCTNQGVPIGWSVHTGADSMRYAVGSVENQRADQQDDFGMLQGIATQTVRGYSLTTDRRDLAKNFVVGETAIIHPLLNPAPVAYTG